MEANRRKDERLGLAIPVRVQGYLAGGATWEELSNTVDVSQRGACFLLRHPLELGHVLRLTLALPKRLRTFDETESAYRVFSLVRFVERHGAQARVGVLFFGQYPPRGFQEHPDGRYLLPGDPIHRTQAAASTAAPQAPSPSAASQAPSPSATPQRPAAAAAAAGSADRSGQADTPPASVPGAFVPEFVPSGDVERRGAPRVDVFVNFLLQLTDTQGSVVQQELTVADNIGRGGARVMTALTFRVGDVVLLQEAGGAFSTRAEVRAVTRVQPTYERLHLRFMDREAPDRLLH